jgi:hypothetical protein
MFRSIHFVAPLILMAPLHAIAAPPQSEQLVDVGIGALPTIDCGSFLLTYDMSGEKARITTYFDQSGNATRMRIRWVIHGTLTHSLTGLTLRDQSTLNITTDLSTNTQTVVGVGFHYSIPGKGLIWLDVGRLIVAPDGGILFETAQHDASAGFGSLCEALGD